MSNYYTPVGGLGINYLGQAVDTMTGPGIQPAPSAPRTFQPSPMFVVWGVLSAASSGASAYHGYKRSGSVGAAIGWGLLGAFFPVITPAVALAQGFGKPKVRRNRRRRRTSRRRR